jgi:hypothetical protein
MSNDVILREYVLTGKGLLERIKHFYIYHGQQYMTIFEGFIDKDKIR